MNMKEEILELDGQMGSLMLNVSSIVDVMTELAYVREKMDNIDPQEAYFYFRELHHKIRLLDDLMKYAARELDENQTLAHQTVSDMYKSTCKNKAE